MKSARELLLLLMQVIILLTSGQPANQLRLSLQEQQEFIQLQLRMQLIANRQPLILLHNPLLRQLALVQHLSVAKMRRMEV